MATSAAFAFVVVAFMWGFAWGGEHARRKITVEQIDIHLISDDFRTHLRHRIEHRDRIAARAKEKAVE